MTSLTLWTRRYTAFIRAGWMVDVQYRADIALWLLWGITEPAVALGIWWSIAQASGGAVDGYTPGAFARYFFGVTLINQLTQAWDAWYIDHWIAEGEMNYRLARPVAPVHEAVADNLAYKARVGTIVVLVWVLAAIIWPTVRVPVRPGHWMLAAIAVVLGAAIRFFNGFVIGLLAFWTTRASSIIELQIAIGLFLSGQIAPLDLLPSQISNVANVLWFPYAISFPVGLLTGEGGWTGSGQIARGFAGQVIWLSIWFVAYRVIWKNGVKRYGAVGG